MNILGYSDAAQLQRRSSDAVIKLVLRCCLYWPNRSGWRQKVIMPRRTFMLLSWWCPLGQSKGHLPAREDIIMDRLIPILTHLSSRWTVPLRHFRAISVWKQQGPFRPWSFWWGLNTNIIYMQVMCNLCILKPCSRNKWLFLFKFRRCKLMFRKKIISHGQDSVKNIGFSKK